MVAKPYSSLNTCGPAGSCRARRFAAWPGTHCSCTGCPACTRRRIPAGTGRSRRCHSSSQCGVKVTLVRLWQAGPGRKGIRLKNGPSMTVMPVVFQAFVHGAQNDLALFVLNAERRQTKHGMYVVDARIGRVEQVGRFGGDAPRLHAPHTADLLDGRRPVSVQYRNVGQCGELLQKPALEYLRIVGVLGGQERAVAEARVEVALGRNVVAADACRRAEPAEFRRVRPGEVRTGGVDLVKLGVQAEP